AWRPPDRAEFIYESRPWISLEKDSPSFPRDRIPHVAWSGPGWPTQSETHVNSWGVVSRTYRDSFGHETNLVAPLWPLPLLFAIAAFLFLKHSWKRYRRRARGLCPNCGYDLRASKDRCPECGHPISPIPEHRTTDH